jgi:hypothetical protein
MEERKLREGNMATWVVYHNDSRPEVLEYVIKDVPDGVEKDHIRSALSVDKDCLVNPRVEVMFSLHGICMLHNAPTETQAANADGKASETLKWGDIFNPSSTPR